MDDWTLRVPLTVLRGTLTPREPWAHDEPALALRGALGLAVLHGACVRPAVDCPPCPVRPCLAADWYDPGLRGAGERPFWLRADGGRFTDHRPLTFTWTFLGALPRPSLVVDAAHRAAQQGLGERRVPHVLRLESWDGEAWRDTASVVPAPAPLATLAVRIPPEGLLRLRTRSRLRLKRGGSWLRHPSVSDLIEALVLRVRRLERALDLPPAPNWPAPGPFGAAAACRWVRADRWSARQEQAVDLSGVEATWQVDAELVAPWRDLLAVLPALQLGSATTAGLGVIDLG